MIRTLSILALAVPLALLLPAPGAWAQTGDEILQKIDANQTFKTRIATAKMVVVDADGKKEERSLKIWGRGFTDSYSEFVSPARDRGIKYFKLKDNLYTYLPSTEKVTRISGHMLRQSVMDSDFSYQDMMEARSLFTDYNTSITGEEQFGGHLCWVLSLTAKRDGVSYAKRKLWVSKKAFMPMKEERYAASGALLKVSTLSDLKQTGARWYAGTTTMEDKLRKGSKTLFVMEQVTFDVDVPGSKFSRRNLMRRR